MRCPCRKKTETATYEICCEPYHSGRAVAPTAAALMRSRYAAFALRNEAYLLATWHVSKRPARCTFDSAQTWISLKINAATTDGDTATVSFTARTMVGGQTHVLNEVSRFAREGGRWYYVSGIVAP